MAGQGRDTSATSGSTTSQLGMYAARAVPAAAGAVGFVGFVALLGAAIDWVRFYAAGLPADQAVRAVAQQELVATGAVSLVSFTLLAALTVLIARLLDPHLESRRGLMASVVIVAVVEACVVLRFSPAGLGLCVLAVGAILALTVFAHTSTCSVDDARTIRAEARARCAALATALDRAGLAAAQVEVASELGSAAALLAARESLAIALSELRALLPEVPIDALVEQATLERDRAREVSSANARFKPQRWWGWIVLAAAVVLGAIAGFLMVDDPAYHWVAVMLVFVLILNAAVFGVARMRSRFLWYGLALFLSIPLFGAALAAERTYHTPKLQPVALIRKSSDRAICGVYVAENDKRIYIARVEPKSMRSDRAARGTGRMFWVPESDVDMISIGQAQSIRDANRRAPVLAYELYAARAENPSMALRPTVTSRTRTRTARRGGGTTTRVVQIEHAGRIARPRPKYVGRQLTSCTKASLRLRRPRAPARVEASATTP